ncbi:transposase [Streptomyces sp. NBC_00111]|uniref:hypothetical protein n=1 Tax=Streptomyces sp. NBC_00111 TaxID=2975655 RepID=UPI003245E72A
MAVRKNPTLAVQAYRPRFSPSAWEIVDAILFQDRTGCRWAYLPSKSATSSYVAGRRDDDTGRTVHDRLRRHGAMGRQFSGAAPSMTRLFPHSFTTDM